MSYVYTLRCASFVLMCLAALYGSAVSADTEYSANTLPELFQLAESNSPSVASAKVSLLATNEKLRQAYAAFLPAVSYSYSKNKQNSVSTNNDVVAPESDSTVGKHELVLTLPLYDRPSSIEYQIAKHRIEKQEHELNQLKLDLRSKVAQAYFAILAIEDNLRLLSAQKNTFTQQLAQAKRSYELGITTITDVHEAQSKIDSVTAQEVGAIKDLEVAKVSLRTLVGKNFKISRTFQVEFSLKLNSLPILSDLLEKAYADNSQIRSLNTLLALSSLDLEKINALHYPSLELKSSISSSRQQSISKSSSSTSASRADTRNTQLGIFLTVPLYSGGSILSKEKEAAYNYEKVMHEIENARLSVREEIEANHTRWKLGISQIEALERAITSSEAALKAVNTGFTLGVRIGLDVFTSQQQVTQLKKDLLKVKYDTLISILRIRTALGQTDNDLF
jgi:outer membrane protein